MDANGSRFHLLLGHTDWARCLYPDGRPIFSASASQDTSLAWQGDALSLQARLFAFPKLPQEARLRLSQRRGAAQDAYGNLYWISASGRELRVRSAASETSSLFWSSRHPVCAVSSSSSAFKDLAAATPTRQLRLRGLSISDDHYLVVGVVGTAPLPGLLVFDLYGGGPAREQFWPRAFSPFDMSARPGGGLFILEGSLVGNTLGGQRLWVLDKSLQLEGEPVTLPEVTLEPFQPKEGEARRRRAAPAPQAVDISSLGEVVAIEALSHDELLLLARPQKVYYLRLGQPFVELHVAGTDLRPEDLKARPAHDFVWLAPQGSCPPEKSLGQLYLVNDDGNQALRFTLERHEAAPQLHFDPCFFPLRRYSGKALVRSGERAYYDFEERWLPVTAQPRPRYVTEAIFLTPGSSPLGAPAGSLFDGKEPQCVWHRLLLDADIPPGTKIRIWSRATDDPAALEGTAWQEEPAPYRRSGGSELPFVRQAAGFATWELLFQKAQGRYLQLKLQVCGDGRNTPRLRALRAYYPRFSYLRYLPALYRQDTSSASFLERFLANIEGLYTSLEDRIAAVQTLFDAAGVPKEHLDWLASWFGVALDPAWDERKQRLFIKHAMTFFRYRGTLRGLYLALRLAFEAEADESLFANPLPAQTERSVRLIERYRTRHSPAVALGDPSDATRTDATRTDPTPRAPLWQPRTGVSLDSLYLASYPQAQAAASPSHFPPQRPQNPLEATFWEAFCLTVLGFIPSASAADLWQWQAFLQRRYRRPEQLETRHNRAYGSFADVPLPASLPAGNPLVLDWYEFERLVLPSLRTAHRFSVLLPVPAGQQAESAALNAQLELARRIVELEKPAHTVFDLKFYWAMFRVGEARLGHDTLLDTGSRATPLRLGRDYLGESYLSGPSAPPADRLRLDSACT